MGFPADSAAGGDVSDELKRLVELAERQEARELAATEELKRLVELAERQEERELARYPHRYTIWWVLLVFIVLAFACNAYIQVQERHRDEQKDRARGGYP